MKNLMNGKQMHKSGEDDKRCRSVFSPQVLVLPIRVKSRNVLDREHWAVKMRDKKEYALLIRNQMRLNKIPEAKQKKYSIAIISFRKKRLDYDNLVGGCKHLIDALIEENFIYDDSPDYIELKVDQIVASEYKTIISRK